MKILMTVENGKAKDLAAKMISPSMGYEVMFWTLPETVRGQDMSKHALSIAHSARKFEAELVIHTANTLDGEILSNALQVFRIPMFGTTSPRGPVSVSLEQPFCQPSLEKLGIPLAPYVIVNSIDDVMKLSKDYLAAGKVVRYHVGRASLNRKIPYLKTDEDLEILCECLRRSGHSSGQIPMTLLEPSDDSDPYGYYLTLFGPHAVNGFGFMQLRSEGGSRLQPLNPEEDGKMRRLVANKLASHSQKHSENASGWFFIKFLWTNNAPSVLHVDHQVPSEDALIRATREHGNWLQMVFELMGTGWHSSSSTAI